MDTYKGAIEDKSDNSWMLTNNDVALLDAGGDVIWASNLDELRSELDVRYPCDQAAEQFGLSRVYQGNYTHRMQVHQHPVVHSPDPDKLWTILQTVGTVCVKSSNVDLYRESKLFDGCSFRRPSNGLPTVSYDPKTAAKFAARRAQIKDNKHVTVSDIASILGHLERVTNPPFPHSGTYGDSSRKTHVNYLAARLVLFNLLYGKNAHRKFKPWQDFAANWQRRLVATDKVFRTDELDKFVDFMAKEIKARKVKALPKETFDCKTRPQGIKLP